MLSSRSWTALLLSLSALLVALWMVHRPSRPETTSPNEALRLATINLHFHNQKPQAAAEALARARSDVLFLQEWTGKNLALGPLRETGLQVALSDARRGTHGTALLARSGVVQAARVVAPPWTGPCAIPMLTARLRVGKRTIGLIGAHAPSPLPACWDSRMPFLRALVRLVNNGQAARTVGVIQKGMPLVLAGDLNALDAEAPLCSLEARGLTDAFDAGSWRLGPTWSPHAWSPALVALDYIWTPTKASVHGAWTVPVPGSDHRAVLADLTVP